MGSRDQQINSLLWREVADKSSSATLGFILSAIFVYFHYFRLTEFLFIVKLFSVIVIASNIARLIISKKILASEQLAPSLIINLKVAIWLNSIGWGIIFIFSAYELKFAGLNFIMMLTMAIGFAAASLVTLGYSKSIYFPFQLLVILPLLLLALLKSYTGEVPDAHYLGLLLFIFFLYQLKQFKIYHAQILERLGYQVDLERSLEEVRQSKDAFMEQTAKLFHASQIAALGDMAGGLAHEVNNSLQVILGSTQQVQRDLEKASLHSDSIKNKFNQSLLAIQKIKAVIDGLKYFSLQMEPQEKEEFPLQEIFERTLNYTFELIKAHQIRLNLNEVPNVKILCHPFQITQVLFNLIKNADDALKEIEAEERWIDITFEKTNRSILIRVKNGGPKISAENQKRLFRPFFSTKDINQGSGLSLSISRGIALEHHGDLYFDATEAFTTFVLKLPVT